MQTEQVLCWSGMTEWCDRYRAYNIWFKRRSDTQLHQESGSGGATRPLLRDGGVEELNEDAKVRPRPKVWTRDQKWK